MLFSVVTYEGWYKPEPAHAAISLPPVTNWTFINDTNPNTLNINVTSSSTFTAGGSAGTSRVMLVGITFSTTTGGAAFTLPNFVVWV